MIKYFEHQIILHVNTNICSALLFFYSFFSCFFFLIRDIFVYFEKIKHLHLLVWYKIVRIRFALVIFIFVPQLEVLDRGKIHLQELSADTGALGMAQRY